MKYNDISRGETDEGSTTATRSTFTTFCFMSALFALLLLVLSMGVFSSDWTGWSGASYSGSSREYYAGIPNWMAYNTVSISGRLPPVPQTGRTKSRFQVRSPKLAVALGLAIAVGTIMAAPLLPSARRASTSRLAAGILAVSLALVAAATFGYFTPVENGKEIPESVMFLVVAIPMMVIVSSILHKSYLLSLYISALAVLIPWWGIRIGWMLRPPHRGTRPPDTELDVVVNMAVMTGMLSLATCVTVMICRFLTARRHRPDPTERYFPGIEE